MSSCHYQDTDRLWCIGLCQVVITKTSQAMSYLHSKCHNWANDTMTVVINMHKKPLSYSWYVSCHDYEGVMSVLCTPLQVKCYRENQQQGAEEESKGRRLKWKQANKKEQVESFTYLYCDWQPTVLCTTCELPLHNMWTVSARRLIIVYFFWDGWKDLMLDRTFWQQCVVHLWNQSWHSTLFLGIAYFQLKISNNYQELLSRHLRLSGSHSFTSQTFIIWQ